MSPATQRLHDELTSKARTGWEKNGYDDGLVGRDDRVPFGSSLSVRDRYKMGWYDGQQVKAMTEGCDA